MKKQKSAKKIILGVTGGLACGKSTVAGLFSSYGAGVIDADVIAHKIIGPQGVIYKKIIALFGEGILNSDKTINRHKLAGAAFSGKKALKRLNMIMHPEVIRVVKERIKKSKAEVIVLDAPLLIEAGLTGLVDKLIVVRAGMKERISRSAKYAGLSKTEVYKRIHFQMPLKKKISLADFIIDNTGTIEKTKKQVKEIRRMLWRN